MVSEREGLGHGQEEPAAGHRHHRVPDEADHRGGDLHGPESLPPGEAVDSRHLPELGRDGAHRAVVREGHVPDLSGEDHQDAGQLEADVASREEGDHPEDEPGEKAEDGDPLADVEEGDQDLLGAPGVRRRGPDDEGEEEGEEVGGEAAGERKERVAGKGGGERSISTAARIGASHRWARATRPARRAPRPARRRRSIPARWSLRARRTVSRRLRGAFSARIHRRSAAFSAGCRRGSGREARGPGGRCGIPVPGQRRATRRSPGSPSTRPPRPRS